MKPISGDNILAKRGGKQGKEKSKSVREVVNLIADDKSLLIFRTIYLAGGESSDALRSELGLTRKQCYSRISQLAKAGLVKKHQSKYFVTTFGKIIYDAQRLLGTAIKIYWKLKAIDYLGVGNDYGGIFSVSSDDIKYKIYIFGVLIPSTIGLALSQKG